MDYQLLWVWGHDLLTAGTLSTFPVRFSDFYGYDQTNKYYQFGVTTSQLRHVVPLIPNQSLLKKKKQKGLPSRKSDFVHGKNNLSPWRYVLIYLYLFIPNKMREFYPKSIIDNGKKF